MAWPEGTGTFTAIDATSGKVVWQKRFPQPCYAGTATTAGNLVFVGRNTGELQAYNATTGSELWSFQTGAGANNTATIFQQNGKQYVAFLSGGNSLAATPHGDNLWLFGLDGTLGPAPKPGPGSGTQHAGEGNTSTSTTASPSAGKTVFADNCVSCHGAMKSGVTQVENGGGGMPPFKGTLTPKQIQDVAAFVTRDITNK